MSLIMRQRNIVRLWLGSIPHPSVIRTHLEQQPRILNLPPVIISDCLITTGQIRLTFLHGRKVSVQILLPAYILGQEVLTRGSKCQRGNQCYYCIYLFHSCERLEFEVNTKQERTRIRISDVVHTSLNGRTIRHRTFGIHTGIARDSKRILS